MHEMIKIEHLEFEYRKEDEAVPVKAVKDVSLKVERGSFTAIIGRNGSGKSTLAKCINALLLPCGGVVYVNGWNTADEEHLWEIRQTAGMVFQNPDNQLVSSIVEDDVAFGPENLGIAPDEIRKRVDSSLYSVQMYEDRMKAPHLLSGGQKQRIAIAGVVAMRPDCIVFDEPTAMLDPNGRAEVLDIIEKLHRDGITVVLITHFMEEAARADRVVIMNQGTIEMEGTPEEIFSEAERLRSLNLDVPFAVELSEALRQRGIPVPVGVIENKTLAEYLTAYRKTNGSDTAAAAISVNQKENKAQFERKVLQVEEAPVLRVDHIRHIYSEGMPYETVALNDVSFSVKRGAFVGIIGHTGSGKSTMVQHLNGLLKPKSGSIYVNGVEITADHVKMREIREKIGMVFQYPEYQLFEETVEQDVAFGPANLGWDEAKIRQAVEEALALVGLSYAEMKDRSPFDLSGGQKRRVAIAGVLAMQPEILILDEPTAGLDPKAKQDILQMIERVRAMAGTTILLVSHNMGDIARLADQVLVMDRGTVRLDGSPEEVFAQSACLRGLGLGLPPAAEFMELLQSMGAPVASGMLETDAAVEELCRWIKSGSKE